MESAVPTHLQCPRTRVRRMAADHQPAFPATTARFESAVTRVVMAYFGLQRRGATDATVGRVLDDLAAALGEQRAARSDGAAAAGRGPSHWERAAYVDEAGCATTLTIAYWDDTAAFDGWFAAHGKAWADGSVVHDGIGTFTEILTPRTERFETLFSSDTLEGVAHLAEGLSGAIQEHAYWGGVRDRIPLSQTHGLAPTGRPRVVVQGLCRTVTPQDNICLIRSGQDWTATEAEERRMYEQDVEPVLRAGMAYLRDDGLAIGCYANRYMTVLGVDGGTVDKTFGMSWWHDLGALERWAESHPTHVAIFGAAMQYLGKLGPAARLKLFHEVTVAGVDEQFYAYCNCHDRTGLLRAGG